MSLQLKLDAHLARGVIGFPTALATAVGLVMASPVILTVTTGFGIGGSTFVLAMAIAFVLMLAQASTFAEAATLLPTSGSVYDYISCGLGRFFAITGTLSAYVLVHVFAGTAVVVLSGAMATVSFGGLYDYLQAGGYTWLVGVAMVFLLGAVNVVGVSFFSKAEVFLSSFVWLTLMAFGIAGVVQAPAVDLPAVFGASLIGNDLPAVLSLVGMAMFMFLGVEFVTPLAPELRNAGRVVPRAMLVGLGLVACCMFLYGFAMARQVANVPVGAGGPNILETPLAVPLFAERVMGPLGKVWLGIAFLCAGAATINTLMAGLPRLLYGMALDGALPRVFAWLHPRYRTPVVGIVVSVLIPVVHGAIIGDHLERIMPLVLAGVCAWGTSYLLVTLSVVLLRLRRPELPRAYRSPLFPLPQIVSSVGILIAIWYIAPPGIDPRAIYIPFGSMLGLTAVYALGWTLLVQRIRPFRPVAVEEILEEEFGKTPVGGHG